MIKTFNLIKEILLSFYQVLFVEAKERYEITEVYLEKCYHNKKTRNLIKKREKKKMILETTKLIIAIIITVIAVGLYIKTSFLK